MSERPSAARLAERGPAKSERGPIRIDRHLPNQIREQQVSIYAESGPLRSSKSGKP
jgi:hypothetical protein